VLLQQHRVIHGSNAEPVVQSTAKQSSCWPPCVVASMVGPTLLYPRVRYWLQINSLVRSCIQYIAINLVPLVEAAAGELLGLEAPLMLQLAQVGLGTAVGCVCGCLYASQTVGACQTCVCNVKAVQTASSCCKTVAPCRPTGSSGASPGGAAAAPGGHTAAQQVRQAGGQPYGAGVQRLTRRNRHRRQGRIVLVAIRRHNSSRRGGCIWDSKAQEPTSSSSSTPRHQRLLA
jgi:hypothetical protein